jgi:hypothetical protein
MKALFLILIGIGVLIFSIEYLRHHILALKHSNKGNFPKYTRISEDLWFITYKRWIFYSNSQSMLDKLDDIIAKGKQNRVKELYGTKKIN